MTDMPIFTLEREFKAPRDLVWRAWTDPALLSHWYGPGVETVIHEFDLQPGGFWLNEMRMDSGSNFQKIVFQEVDEPNRLVWHHCSTNDQWEIEANPMMPDWPRVLLTTVDFDGRGNTTLVTLSQVPHEATDKEIACFAEMKDGMSRGWGSGYELVDDLLSKSE